MIARAKPTLRIIPSVKIFIPYQESVELECIAVANPPATPTWFKSDPFKGPMQGPMHVHLMHGYSYSGYFEKVGEGKINISWSPEVKARYECSAWNLMGRAYLPLVIVTEDALPSPKSKVQRSHLGRLRIGLFCALGVVLLISSVWVFWKFQTTHLNFPSHLNPNEEFQLDSVLSVQEQVAKLPYNVSWEYPRFNVTLLQFIEKRFYGEMWEGTARGIRAFEPMNENGLTLNLKMESLYKRGVGRNFFFRSYRKRLSNSKHSNDDPVTIKFLHKNHTKKDYDYLIAQLKLMVQIGSHKNIVNLLGACTIDGPLWLILEHCPYGDLLKFLRSRKELLPQWEQVPESTGSLCFKDLMRMAFEICEGMSFLSARGIVHQDLAARNVFLSLHLQVKIADFGTERSVGLATSYCSDPDDTIPAGWMALEVLQGGVHTKRSDVWSFGVVVWELFSMGGKPYNGILKKDLAAFLREGQRMSAPRHCPEQVYQAMLACWNITSTERPTFPQLTQMFTNIMLTNEGDEFGGSRGYTIIKVSEASNLNT